MPLLYMRAIRPYCTRIDAVFAPVFLEMYNYIAEVEKLHHRACKCPFWANVDILKNSDGGGMLGASPVSGIHTQAAKNLEFF